MWHREEIHFHGKFNIIFFLEMSLQDIFLLAKTNQSQKIIKSLFLLIAQRPKYIENRAFFTCFLSLFTALKFFHMIK